MLIFYNLLQLLLLCITLPVLLVVILLRSKYRRRFWQRLGFGLLFTALHKRGGERKTIWIHGLSVGEVTSALPLVAGIRNRFPDAFLVFSATTDSGAKVAAQLLSGSTDLLIPFPLDLLPVTSLFVKIIKPDLFILVETDFWPNILHTLHRQNVPTMVVNGRVSQKSFGSYRSFSFFFRPMFLTFRHLCMQTENDRANMMALGVPQERIHTLGNLKFDTPLIVNSGANSVEPPLSLPDNGLLLIAGSTHQGEDEIILSAYVRLRADFPHLFLLIAPRDISRGKEIQAMAEAKGITTIRRSQKSGMKGNQDALPRLLVLDTIGELAAAYRFADIAFVGGSLIRKGGHNPIEPAIMGAPVLFGPHMEDFAEISQELLTAGGAKRVGGEESLAQTAGDWLANDKSRKDAGLAALRCVEKQQGVVERHLHLIQTLL